MGKESKIKKYGVGFFSDKHRKYGIIAATILITLVLGICFCTLYFQLPIIIICFFLIIGYLAFCIKINVMNTLIQKFNKDCDLDYFLRETDKLLDNPKLHEESANYIKIMRATYLILKDPSLSGELMKNIHKPKTVAYFPAYYVCVFSSYLHNGELEKAKEILRYVIDRKSINKTIIKAMQNDLTVYLGIRDILNIETKYPLKGVLFRKVDNTYVLMKYYSLRNNDNKAKEYANILLSYNTCFEFINNEAKKTLGILVENKRINIPKTVMIYLEKDNQYLMLYRNKKEEDINKGKYIGVGGHVEENETPDEAVVREVKEETGLDLLSYQKQGIVYFVLNGYMEEMHVYTSSNFKGELIECNEGDLSWVNKDKILDLNLWEGDIYFVNKILNNEGYFEMKLVYENDVLISKEDI